MFLGYFLGMLPKEVPENFMMQHQIVQSELQVLSRWCIKDHVI